MAALADISDALNRATGGAGAFENLWFSKDGRIGSAAMVNTVAGRWTSYWLSNGNPAGAAAAPGAVAAPTRATVGALLQANPSGGRQKWVLGFTGTPSAAGTLLLYDRLLHVSGFSGTVVTPQAVGGALTRYTSATASIGNQIWIEFYGNAAHTAQLITASYTNENGVSGRVTPPIVFGGAGARETSRMLPLPLQEGDLGVTAVASVTINVTTTQVGDFGVTVLHPLLFTCADSVGIGAIRDTLTSVPGPAEILTDACLALAWQAFGTVPPALIGSIHSVEA